MPERSSSYETLPYQADKRQSAVMERDPQAVLPGLQDDAAGLKISF
jgi:hypothetical protein